MLINEVEIRPNRHISVGVEDSCEGTANLTIFFFHGSMAHKNQFSKLREQLRQILLESWCHLRIRMVAADALGCGSSKKPVCRDGYNYDSRI